MTTIKDYEQFELKVFSGYLKNDIDFKFFDSGKTKCSFSIPLKATKDDNALWLNCEMWNADEIADRYKKGSQITVLGRFKEEEYNGKTYTKFIVSAVL